MKKTQKRNYFLTTERIGFSEWSRSDLDLAELLWGNPKVTKYICATGVFSREDIVGRLDREIENGEKYQVQYWPIFDLKSDELIGCCGLRPYAENTYEIGFHLRPEFWGQGYAKEAADAVIAYAFNTMKASSLFAGHNPNNKASQKLLHSLGFVYAGDEFYEPTGLYHPSYTYKMKKLIVILGPNGVGKTTAAKAFLEKYTRSAYVDADWCRAVNPFPFTPATKRAATENIYCMFKNYLCCEDIDKIIFPYAFHGERKEIFDGVMNRLKEEKIKFELLCIVLKCSEQENLKRCRQDGREPERIERGMKNTFHFYDEFPYPSIITTDLTPGEVAEQIAALLV